RSSRNAQLGSPNSHSHHAQTAAENQQDPGENDEQTAAAATAVRTIGSDGVRSEESAAAKERPGSHAHAWLSNVQARVSIAGARCAPIAALGAAIGIPQLLCQATDPLAVAGFRRRLRASSYQNGGRG